MLRTHDNGSYVATRGWSVYVCVEAEETRPAHDKSQQFSGLIMSYSPFCARSTYVRPAAVRSPIVSSSVRKKLVA